MLETIFMPTFIKTLAVTCGIGGGLLAIFIVALIFLLLLYPVTKRFKS